MEPQKVFVIREGTEFNEDVKISVYSSEQKAKKKLELWKDNRKHLSTYPPEGYDVCIIGKEFIRFNKYNIN